MNIETINDSYAKALARIAELEAERDRLKEALTIISAVGEWGPNIGFVLRTARAALSGDKP